MVFGWINDKITGIVEPMLRDTLQTYFSNFDPTKFSISIGTTAEVLLNDLHLRTNVLDQFGIPFGVASGTVGRIFITINVSSLMWGPPIVEVTLEDVYLLLVPPSSIPYDEEQAKKTALEQKRKQLEKLEKDRIAVNAGTVEAASGMSDMVIGIINNVKINVSGIHIRYEDEATVAGSPFAFGLVLKGIDAYSTDADFQPAATDADKTTFFKKADLNGLGAYWNSKTNLIWGNGKSVEDTIAEMKDLVFDENNNQLEYILGPIGTAVKAKVTMSPEKLETPFSLPLADVDIGMEDLSLGISNAQFKDILVLGDSMERFARRKPFLQYRPYQVPYKGNAKTWWKFAYQCALVGVRRRNLRVLTDSDYRDSLKAELDRKGKEYGDIWYKIIKKEDVEENTAKATALEDNMSNLQIITVRNKQEIYVEKTDEAQATKKANAGWSWGWNSSALTDDEVKEILASDLTPEEREKLEKKMEDLKEAQKPKEPIKYPEDFVNMKVGFELPKLGFAITGVDGGAIENVFNFVVETFAVGYEARPAKNGLMASVTLDNVSVTGLERGGAAGPSMLRAIKSSAEERFFTFEFEKNPLTSAATTRVKLDTKQVEVVYDAPSIQRLVEIFTWPSGVELTKVSAAAAGALDAIKNVSADGMKKMVDSAEEMDVDISVYAPYILVPEGGELSTAASTLVINLGNIVLKSSPRDHTPLLGAIEGQADGDVSPAVLRIMYNRYELQLKNLEVLIALAGEDIGKAIRHEYVEDGGQYHVDRPTPLVQTGDIILDLNQCIITTDPRFPKIKADLLIPLLDIQITDTRLLKLLRLILTLPLPLRAPPAQSDLIDGVEDPNFSAVDNLDDLAYTELAIDKVEADVGDHVKDVYDGIRDDKKDAFDPEKAIQLTNLIWDLHLQKIKLMLLRKKDAEEVEPILDFELYNFNSRFKTRTFGTTIDLSIAAITSAYLNASQPGGGQVYLLHTPIPTDDTAEALVRFHLFTITPECPSQLEGTVKQKIELDISSMDVTLHQESLKTLRGVVDSVTAELAKKPKLAAAAADVAPTPEVPAVETVEKKDDGMMAKFTAVTKNRPVNPEDVLIKVSGQLSAITLQLTSEKHKIAMIQLDKVQAEYEDKPKQSTIFAQIAGIEVRNLDTPSLYPIILAVESKEKLILAEITIFKDPESRAIDEPDMSVELLILSAKITVLGSFVANVLNFANELGDVKGAIKDASAAAAAKVVEVAKEKNSSKMLLNIKLDAPTVIMPKGSESPEAILLDLGLLTIKNSLKGTPEKAVLDHMEVGLGGVKISRAWIDTKTQTVAAECLILEPESLTIILDRNLSSSWYTEIPATSVKADLAPFVVQVSGCDLGLALACLSDLTSKLNPTKAEKKIESTKLIGGGSEVEILPPDADTQPTPYTNLTLNVTLQQIGLYLHNGTPSLEGHSGIVGRDPSLSLAKLIVELVSLDFGGSSNSDMKVKLSLKDVVLQDTRPDAGEIKDFIQRSVTLDSAEKDALMLDIGFQLKNVPKNKIYIIDLVAKKTQVILQLDFLSLIAGFFTKIGDEGPKTTTTTGDQPVGKDAVVGSVDAGAPSPTPIVNANIQLEGTDILVLENLQDSETNAFMIGITGSYVMSSTSDGGSSGKGNLNIRSNTAKYRTNQENQILAEIIQPLAIGIELNLTRALMDVGITLPDINLRVSSGTVLLFSKFIHLISTSTRGSGSTAVVEEIDHSRAWDPMQNSEQNFWFLDTDKLIKPADVSETGVILGPSQAVAAPATTTVSERLKIKSGKLAITLEAGVGTLTTPLVLVEIQAAADVTNWSKDLKAKGTLSLTAAYNNTSVGGWEYMVEPTAVHSESGFGPPSSEPWTLYFSAGKVALASGKGTSWSVDLHAKEILEVTVTKTAVEVLSSLSNNFIASASPVSGEGDVNTPPYLFKNDVGSEVLINVDGTALKYMVKSQLVTGDISVASGEQIDLGLIIPGSCTESPAQRAITISIPAYNFKRTISVNQAVSRFYPFVKGSTKAGLLVHMRTTPQFSTRITVRSIVQIQNDMELGVDVFAFDGKSTSSIGHIEPFKQFNVPLDTVYSGSELVFQLAGYEVTHEKYGWKQLASTNNTTTNRTAKAKGGAGLDANIRLLGEAKSAVLEDTDTVTPLGRNYVIKLKPPVILNNFLPIELEVGAVGTVPPGTPHHIFGVDPLKSSYAALDLKLKDFRGLDWTYKMYFSSMETTTLNPIQFVGSDGTSKLWLGCRREIENGVNCISIYYTYWMVNHTGLQLTYKGYYETPEVIHEAESPGPVPFAYTYYKKNTANFKIGHSQWSDKVNLDAAMTGTFTCVGPDRDYDVTIDVTLSEAKMTKIVSFLPKYTIWNSCPYGVYVVEASGTETLVPAKATVPFWPVQRKGVVGSVSFRIEGTTEVIGGISMDWANLGIVRSANKYGGLRTNVQILETKTTLTLSEFGGEGPVLVVNDTSDVEVEFGQKGVQAVKRTVGSGQSMAYTWDDATDPEKQEIIWTTTLGNPPLTVKPGTITASGTVSNYSWISFPYGISTVILLTSNAALAKILSDTPKEAPSAEVALLLDGIGLSLVNNVKARDIMYMRLQSTDVIWEERDPNGTRYTIVRDKRFLIFEHGYQNYITGKNTAKPTKLDGGVEIDFSDFTLFKPTSKKLRRRAYQPGLGLRLKTYEHGLGLNLSLSRLQIDNNLGLPNQFPPVLSVAPIPKSVGNLTEVYPPVLLIDYAYHTQPESEIKTITATVILQELKLAVDLGFVNEVMELLPAVSDEKIMAIVSTQYQDDYKIASQSTPDYFKENTAGTGQCAVASVFEDFSIYKLKLRVTLSVSGSEGDGYFKSVLLGLGSALVSISDKEFEVSGFQMKSRKMTNVQLVDTIVAHYKSGIISNLYTVVLNLNILGNPGKLLSGITTGLSALVEEPFQGAMNGNLIEGVSNGVGAVLGGTVFGLTDTLGTVVSTLGKTVDMIGLKPLGWLVSGLGSGLLAIGDCAGHNEAVLPELRPRRTVGLKSVLEPYSEYSATGSVVYNRLLSSYPSAGSYLLHQIIRGETTYMVLLTSYMAFYLKLKPDIYNVTVNWGHAWKQFVSITRTAGKNELVYNLPKPTGWFNTQDNTLEVPTETPEMRDWLQSQSEGIFKLVTGKQ